MWQWEKGTERRSLPAKECGGLETQEKESKQILPSLLKECSPADAVIIFAQWGQRQTFNWQNCEKANLCFANHCLSGTLLRQPQKTHILTYRSPLPVYLQRTQHFKSINWVKCYLEKHTTSTQGWSQQRSTVCLHGCNEVRLWDWGQLDWKLWAEIPSGLGRNGGRRKPPLPSVLSRETMDKSIN